MSKKLLYAAVTALGVATFLALFTSSTIMLGNSVESLVGPDGVIVTSRVYGQSGWVRAAGACGLVSMLLLGIGTFAALTRRGSIARTTLFLGSVASLATGPTAVLAVLFAGVTLAIARSRQHQS